MKALILEDDLMISLEYEMLLKKLGVELIGSCRNSKEALSLLRKETPDFILLDLHLSEVDFGLNFIAEIQSLFIPYIVITGYPKNSYMHKAQELEAEAFLVKPVNGLTLQFEIEKLIRQLKTGREELLFVFVKDKKNMVKVPIEEIIYIDIDGNYSTIYTAKKKFLLKRSLAKVFASLPKDKFSQVHRRSLVNLKHVKRVNFVNQEVELSNGAIVKLGKYYLKGFREQISKKNNI